MQSDKINFVEKLNKLSKSLSSNDSGIYDLICNFVCEEFDLYASVLFSISNSELKVLGKSLSAKKSFVKGTTFQCDECKAAKENFTEPGFFTDTECGFNISEFVVFEGCCNFKSDDQKYLLKVAQKNPFTKVDIDNLKSITEFVSFQMSNQTNGKSVNSTAETINQISQELRSPVNGIIGFSSILSEESLTSSQTEYVKTIKNNAQNILLLINDIIEVSKVDSGKSVVNKTEIELKSFIEEIVKIYSDKIDTSKLNIASEIENIPVKIISDRQKLKFILLNLISQAIRLTETGTIKLSARTIEGSSVEFKIQDSGKNIPQDLQSKIFEPFALSKIETGKTQGSTGLGLTLTKKYSDLLGASISVDSIAGKGNVFTLKLNEEKSSTKISEIEKKLSSLPPVDKNSSNNKILVIEDDYATAKLLSNYLTKWGYDPSIVNTAEQTLSIIEKEKFLAVIMDIALPNANGLELLKTINEHPQTKNTPVIVCSVESEQQKAFMMGAVEYFVKPIKYNFLVEVLQSYKLKKEANVLCVDDDLPTLNLVKQAIETAGFNPVAENVSANVLDRIKDMDIDLAIVDLDMPDPNGFELIKLIKSEKKFAKLPIVIYTGKENFKEDLQKIDGLFEDLLSKRSTNIEDLADTIKQMINRYETPSKPEEVENKGDGTKILLAEDYKHSQIIVTRLLKKNGFEDVVVVENGQDALELAKKQKFNLILMDMQMPIMNGFEATEKIRSVPGYKDTPIVALTAFAMKGDREKCLDAGATDYIPKPIDSKEFIEKVKYYTGVKEGA